MNERGTPTRGWLESLRRRHDTPAPPAAPDPEWMTGISAEAAAQAAEGRDEGWIVSSWELRRGLQVRECASPETVAALTSLWLDVVAASQAGCDVELPLAAAPAVDQAERSSSRRSAAPSSITAIA